jgi:hypothetical protein
LLPFPVRLFRFLTEKYYFWIQEILKRIIRNIKKIEMKSNDVIFAVIVLLAVGISLYRKYLKKEKEKDRGTVNKSSGTGSFHSVRDDYEPYSGKHPGSGSGKSDA